jgi:hypothetical protein
MANICVGAGFIPARKIISKSSTLEIADFGSGQGRSDFETGGVAALRRGFENRENAGMSQKMLFPVNHHKSPLTSLPTVVL